MTWKIGRWVKAYWYGIEFEVRFHSDGDIDCKYIDPEDFKDWVEVMVTPAIKEVKYEDKVSPVSNDELDEHHSNLN